MVFASYGIQLCWTSPSRRHGQLALALRPPRRRTGLDCSRLLPFPILFDSVVVVMNGLILHVLHGPLDGVTTVREMWSSVGQKGCL